MAAPTSNGENQHLLAQPQQNTCTNMLKKLLLYFLAATSVGVGAIGGYAIYAKEIRPYGDRKNTIVNGGEKTLEAFRNHCPANAIIGVPGNNNVCETSCDTTKEPTPPMSQYCAHLCHQIASDYDSCDALSCNKLCYVLLVILVGAVAAAVAATTAYWGANLTPTASP